MAQTGIDYEEYRDYIALLTDLITKGLGDSLISLVLYGAVARGEASKESDIDILIIPAGSFQKAVPKCSCLINQATKRLVHY